MSVLNRRALTGSTLVVLAVLFIALVMLTGVLFRGARVDLTQDRLYTLSDGTRSLIRPCAPMPSACASCWRKWSRSPQASCAWK
jgi:hypothetical protein